MKRLFYIFTFLFVALSAMADAPEKLFLKPNSNWKTDNARFAAYFFGNGETWVSMTKVEGETDLYAVTLPTDKSYPKVIFCRMNPSASANNWNNKWNQTGDLTIPTDGKNLFTVPNDSWDGATTTWSYILDTNTALYLKPNANWKTNNARFAVYFYGNNGNAWASMTDDDRDGIYQVITPTGIWTNVIFCRMNPSASENNWDNNWNKTIDLTYDGSDKNIYVIADGEWSKGYGYWMSLSGEVGTLPSCGLYVRGNFNSWEAGDDDELKFDVSIGENGRFACTKILTGSLQFKIAQKNNWDGAINTTCNKGECDIPLSTQTSGDKNVICTLEVKSSVTFSILKDGDIYDIYLDYTDVTFDNNTPLENVQYGTLIYKKEITNANVWHWISLPFYVKISDIDGAGVYGADNGFIIQEYDSDARANWTSETKTWKSLGDTETLQAGKGYILGVSATGTVTFKSSSDLNVVKDTYEGKNEYSSSDIVAKHSENDHWHLIGTGLYDVAKGFGGVNYVAMPNDDDYKYYYLKDANLSYEVDDKFKPKGQLTSINPYTSFFVQYGGEYSFAKEQNQITQNAAPRRAKAEEVVDRYYVNIAGATDSSYTAIFLAEDGSDEYVVGQDFLHFGASGASLQLYTVQGEDPMAFNYLQRADQKVVLGGYVAEAGRYTISIAMNGKPASVVLTDSVTGAVVDLLQQNYEFDAERGKLDGRFGVTITYAPAEEGGDDTTTDLENGAMTNLMVVRTNGGVIVEGLTIGSGVAIYDVAGRCVNEFVATETATAVALEKGVYLMSHNGETVKFVVNR